MRDISYVLELGISRVSAETHITDETIQAIIDKDFENLHPTKAIGFLNILQREYDIDFTEWKEEFKRYNEQNKEEENDELFVYAKETNEPKNFKIGITVVIISVCVIVGYIVYSKSKNGSEEIYSEFQSTTIDEAKERLQDKNIDFEPPMDEEPVAIMKQEQKDIKREVFEKVPQETNETQKSSLTESQSEIANEAQEQSLLDQGAEENQSKQIVHSDKDANTSFITIVPRDKIWVGFIDLETFKKSQKLQDYPIELNISRNFTIKTGHGMLDVVSNDSNTSYNSQYPLRFVLQNGELQEIEQERYSELNEGVNW